MISLVKGAFLVLLGLAMLIGGLAASVVWVGFCFGTIVIGVLLLLFAPQILYLPFVASVTIGGGVVAIGSTLIGEALSTRSRDLSTDGDIEIFESMRRTADLAARRDERQKSKHSQGESHTGKAASRSTKKDIKWECSKCKGALDINYGSTEEYICEKCAN